MMSLLSHTAIIYFHYMYRRNIRSIFILSILGSTATAFTRITSRTLSRQSVILNKTRPPVFDEVCDATGVTLKRFMSEVTMLNPELTELTTLFGAIETACKALANLIKRSQLPSSEILGYEGVVNVQGEDQMVSSNYCKVWLFVNCHN